MACVSSDEDVPPRMHRKEELNSLGAIAFLDMWSNWSEVEARNAIETAFDGLIDETKPEPR